MTHRTHPLPGRSLMAALSVTAIAMLVGCQPEQVEQGAAAPPQPVVELKLLDYEGVQNLVKSHLGKVVVLDVWSST